MRRIFAVMCIRNEAGRYLQSSLAWNAGCWDELFVFDDQSGDDSARIASRFGSVVVRSDGEPSFLEHEGRFRETAWQHFENVMLPNENDWVLALDADEFLLTTAGKRSLHEQAARALVNGRASVAVHVPEAWDNGDGVRVRVDGFWNGNWNPRFCSWKPNSRFNERSMGCGSTPSYAWENPLRATDDVQILHVGYLDFDERYERFERYRAHPAGHNPTHIESIMQTPTLVEWDGTTPTIWRGQR